MGIKTMTVQTRRLLTMFAAFTAGLALCFGAIAFVGGDVQSRLGLLQRLVGTGATRTITIGGPFNLTDQNGQPFSDKDLKGKSFLVFFGYTHCPDVCPTTLFEISELLRSLGPQADRTAALFITVDPERDTPEAMRGYLASFDSHIRGLTGDAATLDAVARAYKAYYKKMPLEGGDYTMDHTAIIYLMDKDGRFVGPFNMKRAASVLTADLRQHL
jgi:protein SCO1/2